MKPDMIVDGEAMAFDLEADVARLRAKWFGVDAAPLRRLDADEEAVAAKWLGRSEADRLARTAHGRAYRPAVVTGHYGYICELREDWRTPPKAGYWYVEVFRGAEKQTVFEGDRASCTQAISRLTRMGIEVTRVGSERSPEELTPPSTPKQARSKRFAIMELLKGFRV